MKVNHTCINASIHPRTPIYPPTPLCSASSPSPKVLSMSYRCPSFVRTYGYSNQTNYRNTRIIGDLCSIPVMVEPQFNSSAFPVCLLCLDFFFAIPTTPCSRLSKDPNMETRNARPTAVSLESSFRASLRFDPGRNRFIGIFLIHPKRKNSVAVVFDELVQIKRLDSQTQAQTECIEFSGWCTSEHFAIEERCRAATGTTGTTGTTWTTGTALDPPLYLTNLTTSQTNLPLHLP